MSSNPSSLHDGAAALPDDFAVALAAARGRLGALGSPILYFPVTASTNDAAAALAARHACEGAVVIAGAQTAGRGRRGRHWFSPPGSGLYVSVVLTPGRAPHGRARRAAGLLTLAAGVALADAIAAATGVAIDLKWPNDLYLAGRKVGGILAESAGGDAAPPIVLGYGVNIGLSSFPPELRTRATSLESELGRPVDVARLLVESLAALSQRYDDLLSGRFDAILDAWRARAGASIGRRVAWEHASGPSTGITAGIDDDGALLVAVGSRVEKIVAGEVTWL